MSTMTVLVPVLTTLGETAAHDIAAQTFTKHGYTGPLTPIPVTDTTLQALPAPLPDTHTMYGFTADVSAL